MEDKPKKIYAYPGSLIYSLKPADPHTVEYTRADLTGCNGQCPKCQKDLEAKVAELEKQVRMAYEAGQMMCECGEKC